MQLHGLHLPGLVGFESLSVLDWGQGLASSSEPLSSKTSAMNPLESLRPNFFASWSIEGALLSIARSIARSIAKHWRIKELMHGACISLDRLGQCFCQMSFVLQGQRRASWANSPWQADSQWSGSTLSQSHHKLAASAKRRLSWILKMITPNSEKSFLRIVFLFSDVVSVNAHRLTCLIYRQKILLSTKMLFVEGIFVSKRFCCHQKIWIRGRRSAVLCGIFGAGSCEVVTRALTKSSNHFLSDFQSLVARIPV